MWKSLSRSDNELRENMLALLAFPVTTMVHRDTWCLSPSIHTIGCVNLIEARSNFHRKLASPVSQAYRALLVEGTHTARLYRRWGWIDTAVFKVIFTTQNLLTSLQSHWVTFKTKTMIQPGNPVLSERCTVLPRDTHAYTHIQSISIGITY